ncbi:molybdopterin-dependent oxidoreductase [Vibrio sinaloensis]|uniref:molybdopterin-dependent oxidoreductase n=1 Tax=Photobacterium sp. (strain ATCC 43367) TaxID=379097 RepID=UPI00204F827F|nr:molybdopterin-dependent oxidoreductase [Vibrio sinaloensis]UPQ89480.1 hypothetical protein MTO69_17125 [Vibrio sinaloensis]
MNKIMITGLAALGLTLSAWVMALPTPSGEPILWISGAISETNSDSVAAFDEAMVSQLPQATINTNNHVVESVLEYQGPTLESVLELVGAKGESVKVVAWDDYVVSIPVADITKYQVLLATHEAGERMSIDDKGPFFVVFPFADHPELRNDYYYSLSVWQVKEIIVE